MSTSYELVYFPVHGRAEPIRLLFALAGQPFTNRTLTRDEWVKQKSQMPLGQIPVLIERDAGGERVIPQSMAIVRHLARRFDLYGATDDERLAVDVALDTAADAGAGIGPLVFGPGRGDAAAFAKHFGEVWPTHARRLETLLASNKAGSGFYVGARATCADVAVFQLLHAHLALSTTALDGFDGLRAFYERLAALPQWQTYLATRAPHEGAAARPAG